MAPTGEPGLPPRLGDAAFHGAMAHLYRAEVHRVTVWRTRLDTTTNWAILLTTGLTTFTLGSQGVPHYTLLLGVALNLVCLFFEGRRYQHLHHTEWRLRRIERGYFAPLLAPGDPDAGWDRELAADLRAPHATIPLWRAVRRRLKRNYLLLLYFITAVWLTKLFIHGVDSGRFYERLAVGRLFPSWFVAGSAIAFVLAVTAVAFATGASEPLERVVAPDAAAREVRARAS